MIMDVMEQGLVSSEWPAQRGALWVNPTKSPGEDRERMTIWHIRDLQNWLNAHTPEGRAGH